MQKASTFLSYLLIVLCTYTDNTMAEETVYINDELYVPLRSGQSNEYRIINRGLRSGTALTRIEQNEDQSWSKVRTQAGVEGWVPNQYLSEKETAALLLTKSQARVARLEKELQELKQQNTNLSQTNQQIKTQATQSQNSSDELSRELEKIKQISANAIDLDTRYRELLEKHEVTQTQRDSLLAENENLKSDKRLSFMFYGAGILILGMVLSVILPALKPKKRYSDWA
ncbi:hypothetical protein TDB9533_02246 [Thalassocella blandensis]|nr:hypothetical protein TDB9533_02246 [Thalassocella blandensis]